MTDEQRIAAIRERCDKAPAAPWEYSPGGYIYNKPFEPIFAVLGSNDTAICNAEFIANARTDIPYLLDQLSAKDAEIERLTKAQTIDTFCGYDTKWLMLVAEMLQNQMIIPNDLNKLVSNLALAHEIVQKELSNSLERVFASKAKEGDNAE